MKADLDKMTPQQVVDELDRFIVGQDKAKRAVAVALRNRLRRRRLPEDLRDEVTPKNIIMIGPTGVGKTEIARRLAKLCRAPFVKVEATKYTEIGYVGRDVESMIRDLASVAVSMVKDELQNSVREEAEKRVEDQLLELLLPGISKPTPAKETATVVDGPRLVGPQSQPPPPTTADKFRQRLRTGELDDKLVEVSISKSGFPSIEIFSGTSFEEMDINIGNLSNLFGGKKKMKKVPVKRAREVLLSEEMDRLVDIDRVNELAVERVQEMGIVFLDEIDKIASKDNRAGVDVSREGVQRDILPIVEGSKVTTKHGIVDTSHILFIAAGAFHMSKPSDLIPELQGRFPIRVELTALTAEDFKRILTQPKNALITQYTELLRTEDVELEFTEEAIDRIAQAASTVNASTENIGARRLHTILEHVLEEISFHATEAAGQKITVTKEYIDERLSGILEDRDLTRFVL